MACGLKKFILTKGMDNEITLTIKQNATTLPMVITNTDTFVAKMYLLSDDSLALTPVITVSSMLNGEIKLMFTQVEVEALVSSKGPSVDRYYIKPMYRLIVDCVTANNGNFAVRLPEVYVE